VVVSRYSPQEAMLVLAARLVPADGVVFVGFNWPMLAVRAARRLHAPHVTVVYENGIVEDRLTPHLPTAPTDLAAADGAPVFGTSVDALLMWLRSGRVDTVLMDAPIVDSRGNVNSTVVGDYWQPRVRLAGSGGGADLSATGRSVILLCSAATARAYPVRVDYVTSPGRLDANEDRDTLGYPPGRGPVALVTPVGMLCFGSDGRLRPAGVYPEVTEPDLRAIFGWLPTIWTAPAALTPPTPTELTVVRGVLDEARQRLYRVGTA
jgi:glutaconate CoA-transferase subunit B